LRCGEDGAGGGGPAPPLAAAQDWLFDPARMLDRKELVV
jgi:hypothetical protein